MAAIDKYLDELTQRNGSSLHLAEGRPAGLRQQGVIAPLANVGRIPNGQLEQMVEEIAPPTARQSFETRGWADFAYVRESGGRFQLHVYRCEGGLRAVARRTPEAATLEELGLPPLVKTMTRLRGGLVVAAGPSGAGKSTTLGAMLREIDSRICAHIVTVEDPIDFVHHSTKAGFTRRQVGEHTATLTTGLEQALRMSPDVIYLSRIDDEHSASLVFTAAESGILVLTSVVSNGVVRALERLVELFPERRSKQVWRRLAGCLTGALAQVLVPSADGRDRCIAVELLLNSRAAAAAIREGDTDALDDLWGRLESAQPLDDALAELVQARRIRPEDAQDFARDKTRFSRLIER
jgi:twitching motility protein PilT